MLNTLIQLVVFDLGRVMIHIADGWEGACQYAGVPYRPVPFTPEERAAYFALEHELECGRITLEEFAGDLQRVVKDVYTADELRAMYLGIIQDEFPGIAETVTALKAAGVATACLSNTCAPHWAEFQRPERYPAICALDFHHASHLFGVRKPDPAIYQQFEQATGYAPMQILFFDDRSENIDAALACSWRAVRITPELPSVEQIREALAAHGILISLA